MSEIIIRRGTIEDMPEIQRLNQRHFSEEEVRFEPNFNSDWPFQEKGEEYFNKVLSENNRAAFVAEDDGKLVGLLCAKSYHEEIYKEGFVEAEIENLFVLEAFRSQGIGRQLIDAFKEWAKTQGAKRLIVDAFSKNVKALKFYRNNGFEDFHIKLKIDI